MPAKNFTSISIETPFPNDLAPFKIVRTSPVTGKRTIVDSAITHEKARELLLKHLAGELLESPPSPRRTSNA